MAGNKEYNSDLQIKGKINLKDVPNNTPTGYLVWNSQIKDIAQRSPAQTIVDLNLITATNIASLYYNKTQVNTNINTAIDAIQIGGRNLAKNSKGLIDSNSYYIRNFLLSENLVSGEKYVITLNTQAVNQNANTFFRLGDIASNQITNLLKITPTTFQAVITYSGSAINELVLFREPNDNSYYQFLSIKVEKGTKATDWTPAPEDQVSDWNTTDVNNPSFIKNKPTSLNGYGITDAVTLNTTQTITGLKNFTTGFNSNNYNFRTIESSNVISIAKDSFNNNTSLSGVNQFALAMGDHIFPSMNLQPYDPVTEPWNNKGYIGLGFDIFPQFRGDTNYRPNHNAHDSWIAVGRGLGIGFLDGTNIQLFGNANMHKNDVKYADSVTIIGKGNTNGTPAKGGVTLNPNRVVTSVNGSRLRDIMTDVIIVGHENWSEDIHQSIIVGSNTRPVGYVFNSLILGHGNSDYNVVFDPTAPKINLDSDVIIGMGNWKKIPRHEISHNLLIGMDYTYTTGGVPNPLYRSLIEGVFRGNDGARLKVNGTLISGHEKLNDDLPNSERIAWGTTFQKLSNPVVNISTDELTFNGSDSITNNLIYSFPADSEASYFIRIESISTQNVGTWGFSLDGNVDSGNVQSWVMERAFTPTTATSLRFTSDGNFKAVIKITINKTMLNGVAAKANLKLLDSSENTTLEVRTGILDMNLIALGRNSGKYLNIGNDTILIGNDIFSNAILSKKSILIGHNNSKGSTNIDRDIMIGHNIMTNSVDGSISSTFIGNGIAKNATTRLARNISIGDTSFENLKEGNDNVNIGQQAGNTIESTTGSVNLGYGAGRYKSGNTNIFLGGYAGGFNITQSTFNNIIVIGYQAEPEGGDNTITIGNGAVTDNYFRGTIHASSFKVRGGANTSVLLADGTTRLISSIAGSTYSNGTGLALTGDVFSVNYGTTSGTAAQGNDARINNGQTAFNYGDHRVAGYATTSFVNVNFDKYGSWNLKMNGIQKTTVVSGATLDLNAGSNVSLAYGAGGIITINATDTDTNTTYSAGDGISITGVNNIITNTKPNIIQTLGGSGNTIMLSNGGGSYTIPAQSWNSITGKPVSFPPTAHSHSFESITGKPATVAGYGITDAYVKTQVDANIKTAVDDIQIGGRNYLRNSKTLLFGLYGGVEGRTQIVKESEGTNVGSDVGYIRAYGGLGSLKALLNIGVPKAGEVITLSFKVKSFLENFTVFSNQGGRSYTILSDENIHYVKWVGIVGNGDGQVHIQLQGNDIEAYVWDVKYEKGNKATDWTPALEDQISDWNTTDPNDFSFIKNKPTSLSGYGITDAVTLNTTQTITGLKTFTNNITANSFVKIGGTNNDVMLADGNTIPKSSLVGTTYTAGTLAEINAGTNATRVWTPLILRDSLVTIGTTQSITGIKSFTNAITAPSFFEGSLRSLKTNIETFEKSGIDLINELEIVKFDRKDKSAVNKIGIIADDSPEEFLSESKSEVDLYKTIFVQAKAIQELTARLEELEKRLI